MRHLYDAAIADGVKARIARLRPDSPRLWGTMDAAQMLAHCTAGFAMARGEIAPRRLLIGRLFGPIAKRAVIHRGEPMRRNSPTTPQMIVWDTRDLAAEQERLIAAIDRFAAAGPSGCTTHPHMFFGPLTPVEWATLMYQHLDHHLRQFQV
jgi:hypothetical protein